MPTPDYCTSPMDLAVTSMDWDPADGVITKLSAGRELTQDQLNELQLRAMTMREEQNRQSVLETISRVK